MQIFLPWRSGQTKPFNSIPRIDWEHPLAQGLIYYAYDTGSAVIDLIHDLSFSFTTGTVPSNVTTTFGSARKWINGGAGGFTPATTVFDNIIKTPFLYSVATAWNLNTLPTLSLCSTFGVNPDSFQAASLSFFNNVNTDIVFGVNNNAAVTTGAINTVNAFHSAIGVSTGSASQILYVDGVNQGTATLANGAATNNRAMFNTLSSSSVVQNGVDGALYYGAFWNRVITAEEALQLHLDPYCFLIYPEDEIFATLVGATAAAFVSKVLNCRNEIITPTIISQSPPPAGPRVLTIPVRTPPVLNAPALHTPFLEGKSEPPTRPLALTIPVSSIRIPNAPHDFNPLALGRSEPPTRPIALAVPVPVLNATALHTPFAEGRSEPPSRPIALTIPVSTPPVLNASAIHNPIIEGRSEPPTRPLSLTIPVSSINIHNAPHDLNPLAVGRSEPPAIGWPKLQVVTLAPIVFNAPPIHNPIVEGRSEPAVIGWPKLQIVTLAPIVFNPPAIHNPFVEGKSEPTSLGWWKLQFPLANPATLTTSHINNSLAQGRDEPTPGGWWKLQLPLANPAILTTSSINNPLAMGFSEPAAYPRALPPQLASRTLNAPAIHNPFPLSFDLPIAYRFSGLAAPTPYSMAWFAQWDQPNYTKSVTEPTARTFIPRLPAITAPALRQRTLTGVAL